MERMVIATLGLLTTVVVVFSFSAYADEAVNLIENPGFEIGSGEEPPGWMPNTDDTVQSCEMGVSQSEAHSGRSAYRIARLWGIKRPRAGVANSTPLPIDPDRKYLLSLWYKTVDVREYALPFFIRVMVNRKSGEPLRFKRAKISRVPDWRQVHILLDGLPEDTVSAQVIVEMYIRTEGALFVDDVVFKEADVGGVEFFEQWRRQELPEPVGNAKNIQLDGTGFFRTARADGRWWFVNPSGQPTWAIATIGRYPPVESSLDSFKQLVQEKYPDQKAYCRLQYGWFEQWGFNSFGGWSSSDMAEVTAERYEAGKSYFPMFWVLSLSRSIEHDFCARDRNGRLKSGSHAFPDPFNPGWREYAEQKAAETIAMFRGKPWFAGYFVDNEADFLDLFLYIWADFSGKEFVADLEKKYGTIDRLNEAWSSKYGIYSFDSFAEVLTLKPEPVSWDDPLYADFTAFERKMMAEYINYTYNLIKRLDPDHLVISNRINLTPMQDIHRTIDLWGRYDVIAMNMYQQNLQFGYSEGELDVLKDLHNGTGRPVMVGEWGVPALDSGLYDLNEDPYGRRLDWSWPQVVRTQEERGEVYNACMRQLAALNFMVGAVWYRPMDADSPTRRSNRGMFNSRHEPYVELVEAMRETNTYLKRIMSLP